MKGWVGETAQEREQQIPRGIAERALSKQRGLWCGDGVTTGNGSVSRAWMLGTGCVGTQRLLKGTLGWKGGAWLRDSQPYVSVGTQRFLACPCKGLPGHCYVPA